MWRQPPPMGSKGSPYSLAVQAVGGGFPGASTTRVGSSANHAPRQVIDDECCMPKLCPGSCTSTTQLVDPLYQVSLAGRSGLPTSPRPPHEQALVFMPKYQR